MTFCVSCLTATLNGLEKSKVLILYSSLSKNLKFGRKWITTWGGEKMVPHFVKSCLMLNTFTWQVHWFIDGRFKIVFCWLCNIDRCRDASSHAELCVLLSVFIYKYSTWYFLSCNFLSSGGSWWQTVKL